MKLLNFTVRNYLSFQETTTTPIQDLTIFIGANGTGKTAMITSLSLFLEKENSIDKDKINNHNQKSGDFEVNIEGEFQIESESAKIFLKKMGHFESTITLKKRFPKDEPAEIYFLKKGSVDELDAVSIDSSGKDLKVLCKKYGLPSSGNKSDLVIRLNT